MAEENLRSSKNALEYSERMFQRGYISELELESQQFSVKRAELELNSAKTAKRVLEDFTKQKTVEDLQSKVETAKAAMESEQAAFELEESKLQRLETQLAHCTIIAPQGGMVVYANEQGRFGQGNVTVEEGAAVRDRQTILRLPDLNQMQVKVKVHESKVEDLQRGMRARINIQGRELQGSVTSVANQPEATSFFQGNVKEYATIVKIDGTPDGLRPGMTAEAEILVAHLNDIVVLPVATVVEQRSAYYCWVLAANGQPERRSLQLGQTNDQFVEIVSGVEAGEQVIRNPRAFVQEAREQSAGGDEDEKLDVKGRFGEGTAPGPADGKASGSANGPNRPNGPGGRPPGGPASPAANGAPAGGGAGGGGGGRPRFDLMQMDTDGDGKISQDEAPGPLKDNFDMMDSNKDGFIDKAEADELRKRFQQGGGGRTGPPNGSASP
ncbi:MAG: efflux RND transporter periplasmic adaptor subunit [Pirellulaceae bacterium]